MKSSDDIRFKKILQNIKSVKIQGAENISKAGIEAFLLKSDKKSIKQILSARPTEPLLQNSIKIMQKTPSKKKVARNLIKEIENSHKKISIYGSKLIKNGMNVYSHCHSSTVIDILKYAKKKQKKNFVVYTSEVEPLLQGRKTAKELAKFGIKVFIFPDLSAGLALKKCDLFLFGADAYTSKNVINKIGTNSLCEIAKDYKVPRFSCGVSMKYIKKIKIEKRSGKELWDEREKNIEVENYAFDKTPLKNLTGIVSEFGILHPKPFIKKSKDKIKKLWFMLI